MADQQDDYVAIHIDQRLSILNPREPDICIFRVPNEMLMIKKTAYEPKIISIGPYHHHKDDLKPMEEYKFRYLQMLLRRRNEDSAIRYVKAMRALEDKALRCYAESINMTKDEFVEMMVLDGCFIIELIRKDDLEVPRDPNDPIFQSRMIIPRLRRDVFLLENQLPFFVLQKLFEMTVISDQEKDFSKLMFRFLSTNLPGKPPNLQGNVPSAKKTEHLLSFVHDNWLPSKEGMEAYKSKSGYDQLITIPCATELKEAGIKFKRIKYGNIFDIKFENGKMLIPTLEIEERTETILRNLIAHEQFSSSAEKADHVLDYTMFMDCLINTTKDVELLRQHKIIKNLLGDDKAVCNLFNSLGHHVVHAKSSYYHDISVRVNKYCGWGWNKYMARLRHDYFNSPWAFISFLGAVVLLLLALIQTIYSILSHYKKNN